MMKMLQRLGQRLIAIGDWPTATVKGALVLTLFSGLVGGAFWQRGCVNAKPNQFPETLRADAATSTRSLQVQVDSLFDPNTDLDTLNREDFFVDKVQRFYLRFPKISHLRTLRHTEPQPLDGLSVAMMPVFHYIFASVDDLVATRTARTGDIVTTHFLAKEELLLEFSKQTLVGRTPLSYNPLDDPALGEGGASLWLNLIAEEETQGRDVQFLIDAARSWAVEDLLEDGIDAVIEDHLPKEVNVHQGLTVISFRKSWLLSSPIGRARFGKPSTFTFFFLLQMMNPEMAILALNHIDVSQDNDAILFDSSFPLRNVTISGHDRDYVEVVKVFLLADGGDFVHVVRLEYLDGFLGRGPERELEESFRSFRVSTK